MKLFYWDKKQVRNFGDELNPYLWPQLLPDVFDGDKSVLFVGIGTLLNAGMPQARKTLVFGSGVGYGKGAPSIDSDWTIYWLRGPVSARALGVSPEFALADPGLYVRRLYKGSFDKSVRFSFLPHWQSVQTPGQKEYWGRVCRECDLTYIDPCAPVETVLESVARSEILITEAMHGAIVADGLRVPWVCVHSGHHILRSKWDDWCSSVEVPYSPTVLPTPLQTQDNSSSFSPRNWLQVRRIHSNLRAIVKNPKPVLSNEGKVDRLLDQMDEKLAMFVSDWQKGVFA